MKRMMMVVVAMGLMVGVAGVTTAKELASGGGTVTTTACTPVKSISAKGDARVGETGLASVQFGWSVAPCDKTRPVFVVASITDWQSKQVYYTDIDAGLDGKVVVAVAAGRSYACTVAVYDAATGVLLGTQTAYASTASKGV